MFIFSSGNTKINIMGYGITIFITSSLSLIINLREVKKHMDLYLSGANIIIYLLLAVLIFLVYNLLTNIFLKDLFIIKNILVTGLTFITFGGLSFFGVEEE